MGPVRLWITGMVMAHDGHEDHDGQDGHDGHDDFGFDVLDISLRSWGPFVLDKYRRQNIWSQKNDLKDKTGTTVGSC